MKFLKCDVARNIDFRIDAVNKASYLEIFCCNALSTCTKVADLSILNDMVKNVENLLKNGGVTRNFLITFKFRHCCWKHYGCQQRQANKERSAPLIIILSSGNVIKLRDVMAM
jgi:hypothetical protein